MENVFHVSDVVQVFLYKDAHNYKLSSVILIPKFASLTA